MKESAQNSQKKINWHNASSKPFSALIGFAVVLFSGLLLFQLFPSQNQSQAASPKALFGISHKPEKPVCDLPGNNHAKCAAHVVTDVNGKPQAGTTPYSTSYGPAQFHTGYNLPCTPAGATQSTCATPSTFGPQKIAIVDAFLDPTVESDLGVYSNQFGLPACTKANGCLQVVSEYGTSSLPATVDSGWALETSLDVQVAHSICQTCIILLVETNSNSFIDLATGVNTAASLGATSISNSYGGSEGLGETSYNSYYNHPGIAVTVSSGDNGYGTEFPAAAPGVVAVGGTTLTLYSDSTWASESVWSGTGSGCSKYEPASSWQTSLSNWSSTGCGSLRAVADMAADADPNTGAAVYDSTPYNGQSGWYQVGGTSLASPLIASIYALTGTSFSGNAGAIAYSSFTSTNSHDVTSGSNGNCTTIMCKAGLGYDGPTGLGTPNGLNGFIAGTTTTGPTVTIGPSNTPSPTQITPTPTPKPRHRFR